VTRRALKVIARLQAVVISSHPSLADTYVLVNVLSDIQYKALDKKQYPTPRQPVVVYPRAVGFEHLGPSPYRQFVLSNSSRTRWNQASETFGFMVVNMGSRFEDGCLWGGRDGGDKRRVGVEEPDDPFGWVPIAVSVSMINCVRATYAGCGPLRKSLLSDVSFVREPGAHTERRDGS
jgi:hypothetical protein